MQLELHQLERKYAGLRIADPARRSQLGASLSTDGQQMPVVVVRTDRAERYVLIDGYQRVGALETLAKDHVDAVVVTMPEDMALAMTHRLQHSRRASALEEGWLLQELTTQYGHDLGRLSVMLCRSRSWVSRRLSLVHVLPESVQAAVREGRVNAHDAMKSLVPLARANGAHCERLVAKLPREAPSSREMERLYAAWRSADDAGKERIVEHPALYLKASEQAGEDACQALRRDLEMLASISVRAQRRVDEGVVTTASPARRARVRGAMRQARQAVETLDASVNEERDHVGLRHPQRDPAPSP